MVNTKYKVGDEVEFRGGNGLNCGGGIHTGVIRKIFILINEEGELMEYSIWCKNLYGRAGLALKQENEIIEKVN